MNGSGVEKDIKEAIRLYRLSGEKGNQNAQYQLGLLYETGEGVQKDKNEAIRLYRMCAEEL